MADQGKEITKPFAARSSHTFPPPSLAKMAGSAYAHLVPEEYATPHVSPSSTDANAPSGPQRSGRPQRRPLRSTPYSRPVSASSSSANSPHPFAPPRANISPTKRMSLLQRLKNAIASLIPWLRNGTESASSNAPATSGADGASAISRLSTSAALDKTRPMGAAAHSRAHVPRDQLASADHVPAQNLQSSSQSPQDIIRNLFEQQASGTRRITYASLSHFFRSKGDLPLAPEELAVLSELIVASGDHQAAETRMQMQPMFSPGVAATPYRARMGSIYGGSSLARNVGSVGHRAWRNRPALDPIASSYLSRSRRIIAGVEESAKESSRRGPQLPQGQLGSGGFGLRNRHAQGVPADEQHFLLAKRPRLEPLEEGQWRGTDQPQDDSEQAALAATKTPMDEAADPMAIDPPAHAIESDKQTGPAFSRPARDPVVAVQHAEARQKGPTIFSARFAEEEISDEEHPRPLALDKPAQIPAFSTAPKESLSTRGGSSMPTRRPIADDSVRRLVNTMLSPEATPSASASVAPTTVASGENTRPGAADGAPAAGETPVQSIVLELPRPQDIKFDFGTPSTATITASKDSETKEPMDRSNTAAPLLSMGTKQDKSEPAQRTTAASLSPLAFGELPRPAEVAKVGANDPQPAAFSGFTFPAPSTLPGLPAASAPEKAKKQPPADAESALSPPPAFSFGSGAMPSFRFGNSSASAPAPPLPVPSLPTTLSTVKPEFSFGSSQGTTTVQLDKGPGETSVKPAASNPAPASLGFNFTLPASSTASSKDATKTPAFITGSPASAPVPLPVPAAPAQTGFVFGNAPAQAAPAYSFGATRPAFGAAASLFGAPPTESPFQSQQTNNVFMNDAANPFGAPSTSASAALKPALAQPSSAGLGQAPPADNGAPFAFGSANPQASAFQFGSSQAVPAVFGSNPPSSDNTGGFAMGTAPNAAIAGRVISKPRSRRR